MNSRSRRIRGLSREAITDRITSCWLESAFPLSRSASARRSMASPTIFADAEFVEYNTKRYHQPGDEFREDWDFASLEHVGTFRIHDWAEHRKSGVSAALECGR